MADQISFLPILDEMEHPNWLLSGKLGERNEFGVFTKNVFEFREGGQSRYVRVSLCADGKFILYQYSYFTDKYGCCHPLSDFSDRCHRANSADFLARMILATFVNSVVPYDKNLTPYKKGCKELVRLCEKICNRIAKEII